MDYKKMALEAYEEQLKEIAEWQKKKDKNIKASFQRFLSRLFGEDKYDIYGSYLAKVGEMTFKAGIEKETVEWVHLQDTCPECGKVIWSKPIFHLEDVGKNLSAFVRSHKCPSKAVMPTYSPDERIAAALEGIENLLGSLVNLEV